MAQSVCEQLGCHKEHRFFVVLSDYIKDEGINYGSNVEVFKYNLKHNLRTVFMGRDVFLDKMIQKKNIDAVITLFGPSLWRPRVPHVCGFARAQLLLKDSPYYDRIKTKEKLVFKIWDWGFRRSARIFYTENPYISEKLSGHFPNVRIYTVSNYYNQIYDHPDMWVRSIKLPEFDGVTCLSVSSPSSHKNFGIIEGIVRHLRITRPDFKIRFVLTCSAEEWPLADDVRKNVVYVGKTDVSECPFLYEQSDIMFMPTLLECFSATYPEAMRMEVPIVTTDLEFARGLCGEAACYYRAIDSTAAAEALYKVATDKVYASQLVENGKKQLLSYDNYEKRTEKLIKIMEEISE